MAVETEQRDPTVGNNLQTPLRLIWRLWAALLSVFIPGLGQAFRGAYRRGIVFALGATALGIANRLTVYVWPALPDRLVLALWLLTGFFLIGLVIWVAIDAFRLRGNLPERLKQRWKRFLIYGLFLVVSYGYGVAFAPPSWQSFSIPSASMEPTIVPGDYLLALGYRPSLPPQRGELSIFKLRSDPSVDFIKRIVGVPGDRIQMKRGILHINDHPMQREEAGPYTFVGELRPKIFHRYREILSNGISYSIVVEGDDQPLESTEVFTVPAGHYFVLGDNRDYSVDSRDRDGEVGFVPAADLLARPAFVFFSTDRSARWWQVWKWPFAIHWHRIGQGFR